MAPVKDWTHFLINSYSTASSIDIYKFILVRLKISSVRPLVSIDLSAVVIDIDITDAIWGSNSSHPITFTFKLIPFEKV